MRYLIDGYNLLFRLGKKREKLEIDRQKLIAALNDAIKDLSLTAILVFDGSQEVFEHAMRSHFDALEIVYTPRGQTADEYILAELATMKNPKGCTVVSNDRELKTKARHFFAHAMKIEEFLQLLAKKEELTRKRTRAPLVRENPKELDRLLKIFEERLRDSEF